MRRLSLLAVVLLSACWPPCPAPEKTAVLASGTYQTSAPSVDERRTLQLDRASGIVTGDFQFKLHARARPKRH